ncbi:uncharacterized protein LOC132285183 [Cornus florida]|uniref:uncharacterized protein LOC132285183 n=1 Tax=Cornus florida TaxID=4283 RepID=UPI0028A264D7|nr:uncharacterized protein LOC132285183 [Cornus florida]
MNPTIPLFQKTHPLKRVKAHPTDPPPFAPDLSSSPPTNMAHHTTNRRNLAAPEPKTSMDPTHKRHHHPKSTPFTTTTTTTTSITKPHPDPTTASSIHNISNHFSKLYRNHKVLSSLKEPTKFTNRPSQPPPPPIDTHLQAKAMTLSAIEDSSSTSFIKSNPQYRKNMMELKESMRVRPKVANKEGKKSSKESHEGHDVKKIAFVSGKTDEVKKIPKKGSEKKESDEGHDLKKSDSDVSLAISGGKRRSFCSSLTELADFFSCTGVKVVSVDMPPFMQVHAVDCARKTLDSMEKFTHKTLALTLKKEFDGVYGPAWHCIVGTSFGSFVTHSVGGFLYFSMDHKIYVLLFKTTVQRAD